MSTLVNVEVCLSTVEFYLSTNRSLALEDLSTVEKDLSTLKKIIQQLSTVFNSIYQQSVENLSLPNAPVVVRATVPVCSSFVL